MQIAKEKNFLSAVVYAHNDGETVGPFLTMLCDCLTANFEHSEIVVADDASTDSTRQRVEAFARQASLPVTLLCNEVHRGREQVMNAAQSCAIGDFVLEFDTMRAPYDAPLIMEAYREATAGSDIVAVGPEDTGVLSGLFYGVFNRFSACENRLDTEAFRVLSRRAINRVNAGGQAPIYRKAAYASCGLKLTRLSFEGNMGIGRTGDGELAIDSLILYTNAGYRCSLAIATAMMVIALAELVYTLVIFARGSFVEGWVTTMFVLTLGLAGLFVVLTIVIRYLSLILRLTFRRSGYLAESIQKYQK